MIPLEDDNRPFEEKIRDVKKIAEIIAEAGREAAISHIQNGRTIPIWDYQNECVRHVIPRDLLEEAKARLPSDDEAVDL